MPNSQSAKQYKTLGEDLWKNRTEKVNAELFSLTYGALVVQLIKDYEDYEEVNRQLDKMGHNIGIRLIEDFLARTSLAKCSNFGETAEIIAKVGFKTFLNITPTISYPNSALTQTSSAPSLSGPSDFILTFDENPLAEFAELPADAVGKKHLRVEQKVGPGGVQEPEGLTRAVPHSMERDEIDGKDEGLWFSNVLCGVIRGCLEMINLQVEARFVADRLRGDETTEIHVKLLKVMEEEQPVNDE